MDEWDVSCDAELPCSFVSQTGSGVITLTGVSAHCKRFELNAPGETTTAPVYWRTIKEPTTRQGSGQTTAKRTDVYEHSTALPKQYRYETTITVEGYVSDEVLASGKTSVIICKFFDGYVENYSYGITAEIRPDGTFSGTKTVQDQLPGAIGIYQVRAE